MKFTIMVDFTFPLKVIKLHCISTISFILFNVPFCSITSPIANYFMNGILTFSRSSVGRKIIMSLTGLFLCLFLIEHLMGNLLLLVKDGGAAFEAYSEFLTSNPYAFIPLRVIEIGLFLSIVVHAWSGISVWIKNRRARQTRYEEYSIAVYTKTASRWMLVSASGVFIFLVIHLKSFFYELRLVDGHVNGYYLAQQLFSQTWYSLLYLVAFGLLGFHLYHGFQSAFQTLGLKTKKYAGLIDAIAVLFWLIIPLGFAIIPIYFLFFYQSIALAQ